MTFISDLTMGKSSMAPKKNIQSIDVSEASFNKEIINSFCRSSFSVLEHFSVKVEAMT